MTVVRRMTPVNRLAALIHAPGGLKTSQAVAAAEANLESVRAEAVERLDAIIASLETEEATLTGYDATVLERMYRLSNEVVGVAGVFGYGHMGEAAYSLCDFLDQLRAQERWSPAGVRVHLQTLRLLRQRGGPAAASAACAAILAGLRPVAARIRAEPAA